MMTHSLKTQWRAARVLGLFALLTHSLSLTLQAGFYLEEITAPPSVHVSFQ